MSNQANGRSSEALQVQRTQDSARKARAVAASEPLETNAMSAVITLAKHQLPSIVLRSRRVYILTFARANARASQATNRRQYHSPDRPRRAASLCPRSVNRQGCPRCRA